MVIILISGIKYKLNIIPNALQNVFELILIYFEDIIFKITNSKKQTRAISPWIFSLFLFLVISNLITKIPGLELLSIAIAARCIKCFKVSTSDLNVTFALSLIAIILTHFLSIKYIGLRNYCKKFINFKYFPILFFVGILELFNEITKIISFAFRLYGNMIAGEKILTTMYSICPFIIPIPFICLEFMISIMQSLIFVILTIVFMHNLTYI
jgi:F-type H+-transporting ATPase subunit a